MSIKNEGGSIHLFQRDQDKTLTERQWQDEVIAYAREHGWMVAHFRPARTAKGWRTPMQGDPGFPDLVLARDGKVLLIELKRVGQHPTIAQNNWMRESGHFTCWTPEHRDLMQTTLA